MHPDLEEIPARILDVAVGALTQANHHAVYYDPGMDHWTTISVLNAAMAGELFLKAIVAKEHPLLIFRDLFQLDDPANQNLKIQHIIEKGKTYSFEQMPKLLWVTTGERLPDVDSFEQLRKARNTIQHFCSPAEDVDLQRISLEFLYRNIDPLIKKHFNLCAVEYHEDQSVGYDYVVACLIGLELLFSIPEGFSVPEIDLSNLLSSSSMKYKKQLQRKFAQQGFDFHRVLKSNIRSGSD